MKGSEAAEQQAKWGRGVGRRKEGEPSRRRAVSGMGGFRRSPQGKRHAPTCRKHRILAHPCRWA